MEYTAVDVDVGEKFIEHHGILDMKWGRRRFQNPDGTLTPEGKIRYSREKRRQAAKNLKKARKVREANKKKEMKLAKEKAKIEKKKAKIVEKGLDKVKKNSKLFSNEEIANLVNRNQLESRLADAANNKNMQKGKIKVDNVLDFMGKAANIADSAGRIYRNINPILEDNGVFLNRDKRNDYIYKRNSILKKRKYDAMENEWDEAMADAKYKFLKENANSKDLMYRLAKADIEKNVNKLEYDRDHPGNKQKMNISEATKAINKAIDRDGNTLGIDADDLIDFLVDNDIITESKKKK